MKISINFKLDVEITLSDNLLRLIFRLIILILIVT